MNNTWQNCTDLQILRIVELFLLNSTFSAGLVLEENQLLRAQESELKGTLANQQQEYHAHLGSTTTPT